MSQPKIAKVHKPKAERIEQQIRTLVQLGKSDDEIAAFLGVTVGSSPITCSQPGPDLQEAQEKNSAPLRTDEIGRTESGSPNLLLAIECNGFEQATPLRLLNGAIVELLIEAEVRGSNLGQLRVLIVTTAMARGLSQVVDGEARGRL